MTDQQEIQRDINRLALKILGHAPRLGIRCSFHQMAGMYRAAIWTETVSETVKDSSMAIDSLWEQFVTGDERLD